MAAALARALPDAPVPAGALVVPTQSPEHGDYQCNLALSLARHARANPRQVATKLIEHLEVSDLCRPPEIAGPGFINLRLDDEWVAQQVRARLADPRLGVEEASPRMTVVVDYSSPNVAKPMHVGHIRSTVIGDALARLMRFLGHRVIGDNHLGDWGTQFGMMILGYRDLADPQPLAADPVHELKRVYRIVNERCKSDAAYAETARQELVRLQAGDADNMAIWHKLMEISRLEFDAIYQRLDIHFDHTHGESFYNPMLTEVVEDLTAKGIAREDGGALVVFFDEPEELKERPTIIRKKDGAFLYATTDLAAIRFRMQEWAPDLMIYVTDGRQQLHFKQLFQAARLWGYTQVDLVHSWFGTILGADNKPIKTREGEPVELEALLDEALERALAIVREKQPELSGEKMLEVARVVGLGAVKYSDLAQARTSDYVFSWDRMLALQGNTAPYLQYAYVRIGSILEKAGVSAADLEHEPPVVRLEHAAEQSLARHLMRFEDVLREEAATYRPNVLTTYLFEVATRFSTFYENCPVVSSEEPLRSSRLALCHLTARTLAQGLDLLGIGILPRM